MPSPHFVPHVALSRTTCVHVPRGGVVTFARGPQSSASGAVPPCPAAVMQRAWAAARPTYSATVRPIGVARSGQAAVIVALAFASLAATLARVFATSHVLPACAFFRHDA